MQTLGVADGKLYQTERASEEVENKRAKYFERQANEASTSQSSHAR